MRLPAATLTIVVLFAAWPAVGAGQPAESVVRGRVTDSSGGVLPGVTVVAAATNGRLLSTEVTDSSGNYVIRALPAELVTLTFALEGFSNAAASLVLKPGVESRVVARLELAPLSETIVVRAPAVVAAPAVRFVPPPPPSPPPPPVVRAVPVHDRDSICGPAKPNASPESLGMIRSGREDTQGATYTTGAVLAIDGGLQDGLEVGRNLIARRYYHVRGAASADVVGEHSAGLVQIVAAAERTSVAVVVYACDELRKNDFLGSFQPEPIRAPDPRGTPVYYDAARIVLADEGQTLGAPRRLMVIDRGTEQGIHAGQRFTLFRQGGGGRRDVVGDAIVVAVRTDSATIRVDRVSDIVVLGDWAAPQSASSVASRQR
jgi:hypothetical protein